MEMVKAVTIQYLLPGTAQQKYDVSFSYKMSELSTVWGNFRYL